MQSPDLFARDFSAISPSARSLLLLKGLTRIPFIREAAALMTAPEPYAPDVRDKPATFWARVLHFEYRYLSIDQLLEDTPAKCILELSSGFSFRGLAKTQQPGIHYIDTDLPEIISRKEDFIRALSTQGPAPGSTLELVPLNALDETQFAAAVARFPPGPVAIVNEGLLVYLDTAEKEKLCGIIRRILQQQGGCWITADIYIKNPGGYEQLLENLDKSRLDLSRQFYEQHHIEDNKFDSIEAARAFFERMGFVIDREAQPEKLEPSVLPYLQDSMSPEQLSRLREAGRMQTTWRLKVAD